LRLAFGLGIMLAVAAGKPAISSAVSLVPASVPPTERQVHVPALARIVRSAPLSPGEALTYGRQVADAIVHAHPRGIVHRDLKSSNVARRSRRLEPPSCPPPPGE
jgi:serine/threonine protein kinase